MAIDPFLSNASQIKQAAKKASTVAKQISDKYLLKGQENISDVMEMFNYGSIEERLAAVNIHLKQFDVGSSGTIEAFIDSTDNSIKFRIPFIDPNVHFTNINEAFEEVAKYRVSQVDEVNRTRKGVFQFLSEQGYESNLTNPFGGVAEIEEQLNARLQAIISSSDPQDLPIKELLQKLSAPIYDEQGTLISEGYDFASKGIGIRVLNFGDELILDNEGNLVPATGKVQQALGEVISSVRSESQRSIFSGSIFLDDKTAKIMQFTVDGKAMDSYTTNLLLAALDDSVLDSKKIQKALASGDTSEVVKMLQKMIKRAKGIISDRPLSIAGQDLENLGARLPGYVDNPMERVLVVDRTLTMFEKYAFGVAGQTYDYNQQLAGRGGLFEAYGKSFNPKATAQVYENINPDDFFGRILENYQTGLIGADDVVRDLTPEMRAQEVNRLTDAIIEHNRLLKSGRFGEEYFKAGKKSLEDFLLGKIEITEQEYRNLSPQARKLYERGAEGKIVSKRFNGSLVEQMFLSLETASDGSAVINSHFFRSAAKTDVAKYIRTEHENLGKYAQFVEDDMSIEDIIKEIELDIEQNELKLQKAFTEQEKMALTRKLQELFSLQDSLEQGLHLSPIDENIEKLKAIRLTVDESEIELIKGIDQEILDLEARRRVFLTAAEHNQITARGNFPGLGNIKSAYRSMPFVDELSPYAAVLDEFDFKSELGFGKKVPILNFSGIGGHKDAVSVDQLMTIFHGQVYENPETRAMRKIEQQRVFGEIKEIFESGIIPPKIIEEIDKAASITDFEIEMLDATKRAGALKNRMIAKEVQFALMTSTNPTEHPAVINEIFRRMQLELLVLDPANGRISPIDPMVSRQTLNTELQALGGDPIRKPFLGRGTTRVNGITATERASEELKKRGITSLDPGERIFDIDHDLFKFRTIDSGHGLLFGGDTVGVFRHAQGGMDLDDKGLVKVATFIDKDGIRKFMTPFVRQPTSAEEIIYGIPAMDLETIRGLFKTDEEKVFMKTLNEMIQETEKLDKALRNVGFIPGQAVPLTRLRRLRDILAMSDDEVTNALRQGLNEELENADELTDAIIQVMERLESKGLTSIENISDQPDIIKSLINYGSATLRVENILEEPQYTKQGVFKIFEEAGSFDVSSPIIELLTEDSNAKLRLALMPVDIKAEIMAIIDDKALSVDDINKKLLGVLSANYEKPQVAELINSMFDTMQIRKAVEGTTRGVGGTVNVLSVAGGTRDWFEKTMRELPEETQNFIIKNFSFGQISAEAAIDLNIGFAGKRRLLEDAYDILGSADLAGLDINDQGVAEALNRLFFEGKFREGFSLNEMAEEILSSAGRQLGATVAFLDDPEKMKFIDQYIIKHRLMGDDVSIFMNSIVGGITESFDLQIQQLQDQIAQTPKRHTKVIAQLEKQISQLEEKKLNHPMLKKIVEVQERLQDTDNAYTKARLTMDNLIETIAFDEKHELAYLGGQQKEMLDVYRRLDAAKRDRLSKAYAKKNVEKNFFIGESQSNVRKAQSVAERILSPHKDILTDIFNVTSQVQDSWTAAQKFNFNLMSELTAKTIYEQMVAGAQNEGLTAEIIINAVEEYFAKQFLNEEGKLITAKTPDLLAVSPRISGGTTMDRLTETMIKQIEITRRLRDLKKYSQGNYTQSMEDAQEILRRMSILKSSKNIEELKQRAQLILEQGSYNTEEIDAVDPSVRKLTTRKLEKGEETVLKFLVGEKVDNDLSGAKRVAEAVMIQHSLDNELKEYADVVNALRMPGTATTAEEVAQQANEKLSRIYAPLIGDAGQVLDNAVAGSPDLIEELSVLAQDIPGPQAAAGTSKAAYISPEVAQGLIDSTKPIAEEISEVAMPTYKRINFESLSQLWQNNKLFKGAAVLGAVTIAGSLVYRHYAGRSNDDMKGPPLLPGGSPYEQLPVQNQQSLKYSAPEYNPGLSYDVSVYGSADQINRFNEDARGLTNGPVDATIHNMIPSVTGDQYSRIASSFE